MNTNAHILKAMMCRNINTTITEMPITVSSSTPLTIWPNTESFDVRLARYSIKGSNITTVSIVVYGYIRDSAAVNKMDIGVKALGTHPRKTEKKDIGDVDIPVKFGGVVFTPGHWLYSDEDGIIVAASDVRRPTAAI
ncbi:Regulator of ribonuclease activity A, putative [Perkinsus marinus ATCC 50983]|uniref:Regulator of ribonuclease activity A, putative n=1 Tax=Perkinsus marinus (strain ATCC 50983 / TXsc) TaxID=423536 RepID=C5LW35_PERM5|nr:Regulator of ribonuclease activity A, putative [Perkinsus marinus ATCC 50983]EEQ99105.1 Regulator of ribonuclease activity A, putative [Perkinsus marinus ATCC 50983]|eukprot:XP_002766388.1 Regulator of ribonuclease activity A, putative [Perkinsus marinus ATCC 50983]